MFYFYRFFALFFLVPTISPLATHADTTGIVGRATITLGDVLEEKNARTPAEKKIDSTLLRELHLRGFGASARHLELSRPSRTTTTFTENGRLLVKVSGNITPQLYTEIAAANGVVKINHEKHRQLIVELPASSVIPLAAMQEVESIRLPNKSITNANSGNEGVIAHAVDSAFETYGRTGAGVKIGVISDSVDYLADLQAAGELPEVTVLADVEGSGEGTAMLKIVHDVAPGAELFFASGSAEGSFLGALEHMSDVNVDIIVDDLTYVDAAPFQLDQRAMAVQAIIDSGVIYFSSAGNQGNRSQSSVYEGDYVPGIGPLDLQGYADLHLYIDPEDGNSWANTALANGIICLYWADPIGASANDYDLVLLDTSLEIVGVSNTIQDGSPGSDPRECLNAQRGEAIVILRNQGAEIRPIFLAINGPDRKPAMIYTTDGTIRGHQAVPDVFTVAASTVPATGTFTPDSQVAGYSGSGNRRLFFEPNGSPITPDNYTFSGGSIIQKPDITAAAGVNISVPGFAPFNGTSAAAPYAAGIAALLLEDRPNLTSSELRQIFAQTAIDIESLGRDKYSGFGIVMANAVLNHVMQPKQIDTIGPPFAILLIIATAVLGGARFKHSNLDRNHTNTD